MTQPVTLFRVHISGGTHVLVAAATPKQAGEIIKGRDPTAIITKIKRAKDTTDAG